MSFKTRLLLSAAAIGCAGAIALPASAQDDGQAAQSFRMMEEITVTARKREETLLEAPVSVTAFTEEAIDRLNIRRFDDLARFTPGFSNAEYVGRRSERPVIRGQSNILAEVQFGVESGVAIFVDGIFYGGTIQSLDLSSIERVEIIRGPQSALYGRNTYGGAINYVLKGPADEFTGDVTGRWGTDKEYDVTASIRGPLIEDVLSFGLNARYYEFENEFRNQLDDRPVGNESSRAVGGFLDYRPTENLGFRLNANFTSDDDGHPPLALFRSDNNNSDPGFRSNQFRNFFPFFPGPPQGTGDNEFQYYTGVITPQPDGIFIDPGQIAQPGFDRDIFFFSTKTEYDIAGSGYLIELLSGYRTEHDTYSTDSDFLPNNGLIPNDDRDDEREFTIELKLNSPTDQDFRWLIGGFYFDRIIEETETSAANPNGLGNFISSRTTTNNFAVFGLTEYDFNEQWSGTFEWRWQKDRRTVFEPDAFNGEARFYNFLPRFTLNWTPTPDLNLYAIYAEGTRPGGLNGALGEQFGQPEFEEEESDNFEIGAKASWFDGRLVTNLAGYLIQAESVQLTTSVGVLGEGVTSIATNQGSAETWGIELEVFAQPIDQLTIGLNYSWSKPEFTEGCDAFEYTLNSGGFLQPADVEDLTAAQRALCDISGNQLPLTSEHQFSANARWQDELVGDFDYFIGSDISYESSKFVQVHNRAETGSATLLGAQIGIESENIKLTFFGSNLLDEDSIVLATRWFDLRYLGPNGIDPALLGQVDTGAPRAFFATQRRGRNFGIEASYRF